jgi:hypothetical protein
MTGAVAPAGLSFSPAQVTCHELLPARVERTTLGRAIRRSVGARLRGSVSRIGGGALACCRCLTLPAYAARVGLVRAIGRADSRCICNVRPVLRLSANVDGRAGGATESARNAGVSHGNQQTVCIHRARLVIVGGLDELDGRVVDTVTRVRAGRRITDGATGLAVPRSALAVAVVRFARVGGRDVPAFRTLGRASVARLRQVRWAGRLPFPAKALAVGSAARDTSRAEVRTRARRAERAGACSRAGAAASLGDREQGHCADQSEREVASHELLPAPVERTAVGRGVGGAAVGR